MNRGKVGTVTSDEALQTTQYKCIAFLRGSRVICVGDTVMQIRMDGAGVTYDFADLDELVLAYAVSIHKSQGTEYPAVVISFQRSSMSCFSVIEVQTHADAAQ